MLTRRSIMTGAVIAPLSLSLADRALGQAAAPLPPSLDELLRQPTALDVALSPDGERIAVLREVREGGKRLSYILINTIANLAAPPTRVMVGDIDVEQVEWANNERLLVWIAITKAADGKATGLWFNGEFIPIPVRRLLAIGADGEQQVVLFNNQAKALKRDFNLSWVVDPLPHDPRGVLMQMWDYTWDAWALHRVDVYTGEATRVERGTRLTDFWFMQDGVPVLRYDSNSRNTVTVFARAPGEKDWKQIRRFRRNEVRKIEDFDVVGASPEPGVLYVAHRGEGEDVKAIREFDLRTLTMGKVVVQRAGRDLDMVWMDENQQLVAAGYTEDRQAYAFSDPSLAAHFKGINTYFKDKANVRLYDMNLDHSRMLLKVSGPTNPGEFYAYNRTTKSLDLLAEQRPWLSADRLAPMETLKVRTRDGAEITAYLTTPIKPGPHPLIVMPHGGPEVRDSYDFDLWPQFMAAQGWMVLQPNFRGSGGYGKAFAEAGHRRWGDRMQDDVEDCVDHVLATGRADARRVAIFGASYGGYAALMGVVRRPGLYRCAVAISGDSDLELALEYSRREEGADSPAYAYWVKSIGDPKADAAALRAASPRYRVAEIRAPILLIHGTEDDIVTPQSSREMAKALKKAGKPHELVELKGQGHSGWPLETMHQVLDRSRAFITKAFAT